MPFEVFKAKGEKRRYGFPAITIQKSGGIGVNDLAFKALGRPAHVVLLFDKETGRIGVKKPADNEGQYAYPIRPSGGSAYVIPARRFFTYYNIDFSKTRRYLAEDQEDGMLVIELGKPIVVPGKAKERVVEG